MNKLYILYNKNGTPINSKYLPNKKRFGEEYGGYKSEIDKILFHDFAVLSRDVSFIYDGIQYYFFRYKDLIRVYNVNQRKVIKEYVNEIALIENLSIDGKPFIELISQIRDVKTFVNVFKPHIALNENGYSYNCKYPPNKEKYGELYEGYKNWAEEVFFHRFGVLCYDVCFTYKNKEYFLLKEHNYAAVCDEHFTKEYEVYANEIELIENFKIDGTPLIELIDKLEDVDSV